VSLPNGRRTADEFNIVENIHPLQIPADIRTEPRNADVLMVCLHLMEGGA
jgi:hypothetical protein